jgi:hypothetical protein
MDFQFSQVFPCFSPTQVIYFSQQASYTGKTISEEVFRLFIQAKPNGYLFHNEVEILTDRIE